MAEQIVVVGAGIAGLNLAGLAVDAVDPVAAVAFWRSALGGSVQAGPDGSVVVSGTFPDLWFRPEALPNSVKNRVHLDVYVSAIEPLLELGAEVLAEYLPQRVTLADIEGNEFCAFLDADVPAGPAAQLFAVCTDSDRPEQLAAWWARLVGARVGPGPDGTPRWLYESAGWPDLLWKFVRTCDERHTPNRWRCTLRASRDELIAAGAVESGDGVFLDPEGNEFELCQFLPRPRTDSAGSS